MASFFQLGACGVTVPRRLWSGRHFAEGTTALQSSDISCSAHVLIVDDRPGSDSLVPRTLRRHGCITTVVVNVAGVDRMLARVSADLIILDMMSSREALSICRKLTASGGPPVIILGRSTGETERAAAMEAGAEYLVSKPWNPRGLLAHVRAVLRRNARSATDTEEANETTYAFAGWRFDVSMHELTDPRGGLVNLTPGEFAMLRAFVERPRRVLTRKHLLDAIGTRERESSKRTIDVQVSRLRRKIDDGSIIRTVRNEGYMFIPQIERG